MKLKDILKLTNPNEPIYLVFEDCSEESKLYYEHSVMVKYFDYEVVYLDAWDYDELRIFIKKGDKYQ